MRLLNFDTALCMCGHPRHRHEYLSAEYPAICSHVDPVEVGAESWDDPFDGVCMCLHFEPSDEGPS